jgi:hypothetical protein
MDRLPAALVFVAGFLGGLVFTTRSRGIVCGLGLVGVRRAFLFAGDETEGEGECEKGRDEGAKLHDEGIMQFSAGIGTKTIDLASGVTMEACSTSS